MKRFVYLFQVPRDLPAALEAAASDDSDIVFLSWRERSSDPRSIHYPSSSWTQGRNRLLREVMGRPYQYLIFGDGDVQLELTRLGRAGAPAGRNPWRVFEGFLREREPAVGCPHYSWHLSGGAFDADQPCQTLRYFDAVLNAFHHEALPQLLPYFDLLDEYSECYAQNLLCSLAADLYPGHVLQTNTLVVHNPQSLRRDAEFLLARPEDLYLESLRDPNRRRNFQRQSYGFMARHPTLGPPRTKGAPYTRTDAELARIFYLDHPLWTRRRELAAMPSSAEFFSDDPNSGRARRWQSQRRRLATAAPPAPPAFSQRCAVRIRAVLGWVRRAGQRLIALAPARGRARARWRAWWADAALHFEIPELRQVEVLALLAAALNELRVASVVFVDVGAGRGDVLHLFSGRSGLKKPVFSVGIDPIDVRGHHLYSAFALAAVTRGSEGQAEFFCYSSSDCSSLKRLEVGSVSHDPADASRGFYYTATNIETLVETRQVRTFRLDTLLRQFGLADEVIHFLKIDAQGSDLDVFLSLGELTKNCLILRLETVIAGPGSPARLLYEGQTTFAEDRAAIEAAGIRLLNISHFGVTPEADVTFVNVALFRQLLPTLAPPSSPTPKNQSVI